MVHENVTVLEYPAVFAPNEQNGFDVSFPDFPGCITFGKDFEEAKPKAAEVLGLWIEELQEEGEALPTRDKRPIIDDVQVALSVT